MTRYVQHVQHFDLYVCKCFDILGYGILVLLALQSTYNMKIPLTGIYWSTTVWIYQKCNWANHSLSSTNFSVQTAARVLGVSMFSCSLPLVKLFVMLLPFHLKWSFLFLLLPFIFSVLQCILESIMVLTLRKCTLSWDSKWEERLTGAERFQTCQPTRWWRSSGTGH